MMAGAASRHNGNAVQLAGNGLIQGGIQKRAANHRNVGAAAGVDLASIAARMTGRSPPGRQTRLQPCRFRPGSSKVRSRRRRRFFQTNSVNVSDGGHRAGSGSLERVIGDESKSGEHGNVHLPRLRIGGYSPAWQCAACGLRCLRPWRRRRASAPAPRDRLRARPLRRQRARAGRARRPAALPAPPRALRAQ